MIVEEWIVIETEMTGEEMALSMAVEDLIAMELHPEAVEVEEGEEMGRILDEEGIVVAAMMNIVDGMISVTATVIAVLLVIATGMKIVETDMMIAGTADWKIVVVVEIDTMTTVVLQGAVLEVLPIAIAAGVLHPIATVAVVHHQPVGETAVISGVVTVEEDVVIIVEEDVVITVEEDAVITVEEDAEMITT